MSEEIFETPEVIEPVEDFAPEKKNKKTLWIILGVVAAILLCCCVVVIVAVVIIQRNTYFFEDLFDLFYILPTAVRLV